jgi:cobalt-zinc-cadmium efflux system membrane fusion protein
MRSRGWTGQVATAVLLAALVGCTRKASSPAAAPNIEAPPGELRLADVPDFVKVGTVELATEASVTPATGKVGFDEERVSRISSPVSGRVVELLAHPGDRVRRGQGLLVIASPDAQAAVADQVAAQSDLAVARRNLERVKRLFAEQAVPGKDVQQAEGDATKAAAALARAASRMEVLGIDPAAPEAHGARFVLRAPIEGVVVERPAFPGMEVRPDSGTPLVTVADLTRLWVMADVYERDLERVAVGQKATVRVASSPARSWEGTVTHVGELVDPATRTVKLRIEVDNSRLELKPEMFARVMVRGTAAAAPALSVPSSAVLSDGDSSAVVLAMGGGRFQKRTIEAGAEQDGRMRVLSGLAAGDQVVVDGALFLRTAIEGP